MKGVSLQPIASRQFSMADQQEFAKFSGDVNPIHIDTVYSRRTMYGQCIVHGIHGLLWALDSLYQVCSDDISNVSVNFLQPIFLDQTIICAWNGGRKLEIKSDGTTLATITVTFVVRTGTGLATSTKCAARYLQGNFHRSSPRNISFVDASRLNVVQVVHFSDSLAGEKLFPYLCSRHGPTAVGEIGTTSFIVGMECPGLQSLFSSLNFDFSARQGERSFQVLESDDRFNLLKIGFTGFFITATIEAFYRPALAVGPSTRDIAARVAPAEFRNVRALIIGGSRGLGEAVAKMIAAGGGEVTITYHQGEMESQIIQRDIHDFGGVCYVKRYSVPSNSALELDLTHYNQIYYFATPQILQAFSTAQRKSLRNLYRGFYIDGFKEICDQLVRLQSNAAIFFPSTKFIDAPTDGLDDYIEVKIEAESLCDRLRSEGNLHIFVARLPRTATDQNQSLLPTDLPDSVEVMLPYIRELPSR